MTEIYLLGAAAAAAFLTWLVFAMTDGIEH